MSAHEFVVRDLTEEEIAAMEAAIKEAGPGHIEIVPDPYKEILEEQLQEALAIVARQTEIIKSVRAFVDVLTMLTPKGDALFQTTENDPLAVANLNHRYTDMALLLNGESQQVPFKLNLGAVH